MSDDELYAEWNLYVENIKIHLPIQSTHTHTRLSIYVLPFISSRLSMYLLSVGGL